MLANALQLLFLFAVLIVFIVMGVTHAFWPKWAVKQPWSALKDANWKRQASMYNIRLEPTQRRVRISRTVIHLVTTLVLWVLFGDRDSPYFKTVWSLWVTVVLTLAASQCFVWAFSPQWLVSRFPSLADGIPTSRAGRIAMRTLGILGLAVTAAIVIGYAGR